MNRAVRDQRRALDRLLRRRSEQVRADSPAEFLARMPIREGPPAPPVRGADPFSLRLFKRRARRWFLSDDAVVSAECAGEHDVTLLVGTPAEMLAAIDRVEGETSKAVRDLWPSFRGLLTGGTNLPAVEPALRLRTGRGVEILEAIRPIEGVTLAVAGRPVRDRDTYFEFLPVVGGAACGLADVRVDIEYRVLVSRGEEQLRHDGGEVVRFESLSPLRLVRVRNRFERGAFGERLTDAQLEGVRGPVASEFRLIPEFPTATEPLGRYRIEVKYTSMPPDLRAEARRVDLALGEANGEYHRLREQSVLRPPIVRLLPMPGLALP